jgi:2-oxoglutarate ferredoxin oxidoreductase subunit alpha
VEALLKRLHAKVDAHTDELPAAEEIGLEDAEVAVFAFGIGARAARAAVAEARATGLRAGLLRPRTLWPFPDEAVARTAARVGAILVAELNLGQLAGEVVRAAAGACRVERLNRVDGNPITPTQVLEGLRAAAAVVG